MVAGGGSGGGWWLEGGGGGAGAKGLVAYYCVFLPIPAPPQCPTNLPHQDQ